MRIVFMGTPSYATRIFEGLLRDEDTEVVCVVTQPDKRTGRKMKLTPPHIKSYILKNSLDIPVLQPETLRDEKVVEEIKKFDPDFIVVAAYGQILPKEVLDITYCINLHASILPKYRGASPIQRAILNMDEFTGVTAMLMDEGLDTGDMLGFSYVKIGDMKDFELFELLSEEAEKLTPKILKNFGNIEPIKQLDALASYAKKIEKREGLIDFSDALSIYAKFRAFYSWPGIFLKSGLKIREMSVSDMESENKEGEILEILKESIIVGCKKGKIEIKKVQPPSKKEMDAVSYLRGKRLKVGDTLS